MVVRSHTKARPVERRKNYFESYRLKIQGEKTRICLKCEREFKSKSKVNRICNQCKGTNDFNDSADFFDSF